MDTIYPTRVRFVSALPLQYRTTKKGALPSFILYIETRESMVLSSCNLEQSILVLKKRTIPQKDIVLS